MITKMIKLLPLLILLTGCYPYYDYYYRPYEGSQEWAFEQNRYNSLKTQLDDIEDRQRRSNWRLKWEN